MNYILLACKFWDFVTDDGNKPSVEEVGIKETSIHLSELNKALTSNTPLSIWWKKSGLSKELYILILQYALPMIIGTDELKAYIKEIFKTLHVDETNWSNPCKTRDFKYIFGLPLVYRNQCKYYRHNTRYLHICTAFIESFESYFVNENLYPASIVLEAWDCIEKRKRLTDNYEHFSRLYLGVTTPPYAQFLSRAVLTHFGDAEITQYFSDLAKEYINTLPDYIEGNAYCPEIHKYIIGTTFSIGFYSFSIKKKQHPETLRLKRDMLRGIFPYIYMHFCSNPQNAYVVMDLNKEEVHHYNQLIKAGKRDGSRLEKSTPGISQRTLPHGTTFSQIYPMIERYCDTIVSVCGEFPSFEKARMEMRDLYRNNRPESKDLIYVLNRPSYAPVIKAVMRRKKEKLLGGLCI